MWNDSSNHKKFAYFAVIIFVITIFIYAANFKPSAVAYAETEEKVTEEELDNTINDILGNIDSNGLDDYLTNDFNLDYFSVNSFSELVSKILDGSYLDSYDSIFDAIIATLKENIKGFFSIFLALLVIVLLSRIASNICSESKSDLQKIMQIVFSLVATLITIYLFKDLAKNISEVINKIFNFSSILFPILLNLILMSGATSSHSVYSSLSVFLLNTGMYVFVYVLMPLSISILLLSIVGSAFSNDRFNKVIGICKTVFKYIVAIFFGIFGLLSAVNLIMSGAKDGVSLKLTKYAIKNYIPVLGGYISDGFDFVHTCSVLIKNAFGVGAIVVLLFMIIKPLLMYLALMLMFKILSVVVSFVGDKHFSSMFDSVSSSISYFIAVLVGVFLIFFVFIYLLIMSVSVV